MDIIISTLSKLSSSAIIICFWLLVVFRKCLVARVFRTKPTTIFGGEFEITLAVLALEPCISPMEKHLISPHQMLIPTFWAECHTYSLGIRGQNWLRESQLIRSSSEQPLKTWGVNLASGMLSDLFFAHRLRGHFQHMGVSSCFKFVAINAFI
jgi:hypothetical protein